MSYLFNYAVLEDRADPAGYHWLNLLLHAVNIGLVYALGLILFEQVPAALLLSAIWALHPLLTESVTNIVGRGKDPEISPTCVFPALFHCFVFRLPSFQELDVEISHTYLQN